MMSKFEMIKSKVIILIILISNAYDVVFGFTESVKEIKLVLTKDVPVNHIKSPGFPRDYLANTDIIYTVSVRRLKNNN